VLQHFAERFAEREDFSDIIRREVSARKKFRDGLCPRKERRNLHPRM